MSDSMSGCEYDGECDNPEYDCKSDSDSDPESLMIKFNENYSNCYVQCFKTEQDWNLWKDEEEKKIKHGESFSLVIPAEPPCDGETRLQNKRLNVPMVDDYEKVWTDWALDYMKKTPRLIRRYNKSRVYCYVHVAGFYGKNGGSGVGVLIRNRQGVPIAAHSSYDDDDTNRVSAFYQELLAADKGIDMAMKLNVRYIYLICTSADVSMALSDCDRGKPCYGGREDKLGMVYNLSLKIVNKLKKRRAEIQNDDLSKKHKKPFRFYFTVLADGKLDNTPARYLARLKTTVEEMGPEELCKNTDLTHYIYKDSNGMSEVNLFRTKLKSFIPPEWIRSREHLQEEGDPGSL